MVVISDSPMFDRGIPSICYGLRGLAYFQIDIRGTKSDLHSGSFGGAVANPAFVLTQVLAQMKDRSGRVKIPGFYDAVRPLSDVERAEWKKLPFNETRYRKDLGAPRLFGEKGYSTLERVWARPTFEVNGLLSGFTGDGAKTVLPAVSMAKVSMRLVPDQDPDTIADLFERYVKKLCPATVQLTLTRMHGGKPWMTEFDNKYVRAAGRAIESGFGQRPVFNREGGSIPVVSTFQEAARRPERVVRHRPSRRERPRAGREARSRQFPQRNHRVGPSLSRDREPELTQVITFALVSSPHAPLRGHGEQSQRTYHEPRLCVSVAQCSDALVEPRHAAAKCLDVLPDLLVLFPCVFGRLTHAGQLEVGLQIAQRGADVVQVIGQQAAVPQLAEGRWRDGQQQFGDVARLRKRAHVHVDALQIEQHAHDDLRARRRRHERSAESHFRADMLLQQRPAIVLRE